MYPNHNQMRHLGHRNKRNRCAITTLDILGVFPNRSDYKHLMISNEVVLMSLVRLSSAVFEHG